MKSFGCKRTEPVIHSRANSRSVPPLRGGRPDLSPGRLTSRLVGRRPQAPGGGSTRPLRFGAAVSAPNPGGPGRLARRQEPSTRPRRRRGPSVGDEFRATFRPVLKHGPRSLTCTRVNGARGRATVRPHRKNHVWRNESDSRRASARRTDDGQATEPTGVHSAPVRSPGASPPGRLRPAGGAPLAYTLVPERW